MIHAARRAAKPPKNPDALTTRRVAVNAPPPTTKGIDAVAAYVNDEPAAAPLKPIDDLLDRTQSREINVSVADLVRHPLNRHPTSESVAKIAGSMRDRGQLEAIVIRQAPKDPDLYEIISGETRQLAAKQIGRKQLRARELLECSDALALDLLTLYNAERTDLNPIEKARMIVERCKPIDQGGCGYTREQAGKPYGLETGAAASNLIRLLELPKVWQDRVASGQVPQSFARFLTPYAKSNVIMQAIDKEWSKAHKRDDEPDEWSHRSEFEQSVDSIVVEVSRPLDATTSIRYPYEKVGGYLHPDAPRLFDVTPEIRKELEPIEISVDGKTREITTNVKAFDKLQIPLVKAKIAKRNSIGASRSTARDEKKAKPKTRSKAEQAAADKLRAEQLRDRIRGFRHAWLKALCAEQMTDDVRHRFLCAFIAEHNHNVAWKLAELLRKQIIRSGGKRVDTYGGTIGKYYSAMDRLPKGPTWRDTIPIGDAVRDLLLLEDKDPRRPLLDFDVVDAMAAELGVDLEAAWRFDLKSGAAKLEQFLQLHTGDQIDALNASAKWGFSIQGKGKAQKLAIMKAVAKPLRLPKSLAPVAAAAPAGKKRKRGR